jgi:hypothetical protein
MSSLGTSFTDKQGPYLAFLDAYTRVNGRPPAEADMQRHFRVSPPSVHHMVLTLERAGLIRRQPGLARSIEVLVDPKRLPVLSRTQPVNSSVQRNEAVSDVLLPVGQLHTGKDETHGIERDNARQRHWLARFRRRSIVVSKAKRMVDVSIALFARFAGNNKIGDLIAMLA